MKEFLTSKMMLYIIVLIVVMFVITKIMQKFGIIKTSEETAMLKEQETPEPYLIGELKLPKGTKHRLKSSSVIKEIAEGLKTALLGGDSVVKSIATLGIYNAVKGWNTDESAFYSNLYKIKSKAQFNQLVNEVRRLYNIDLFTNIVAKLNDSEYLKFRNYVKSLPLIEAV